MKNVVGMIEAAMLIPGWTPADELLALYALALGTSSLPGDVVEIGSWCGRSSVVLAEATQHSHAVLYCVDLWPERQDWYQNTDGSWSFKAVGQQGYGQQTVWNEPFVRDIEPVYRRGFLIAQFHANVAPYSHVGVLRGTSSAVYTQSVRLAFLDGDHGYDAVMNDVHALSWRIVKGGWLCFDDAHSGYEGVDRAIAKLAEDSTFGHGVQLTRKLWAVQKR